jgi:hypothetical protein
MDWFSGNLEENCQASQEMDAAVQGRLAANHWELVKKALEMPRIGWR